MHKEMALSHIHDTCGCLISVGFATHGPLPHSSCAIQTAMSLQPMTCGSVAAADCVDACMPSLVCNTVEPGWRHTARLPLHI